MVSDRVVNTKKAYLMRKLILSSKLISLFKRSQFCFFV